MPVDSSLNLTVVYKVFKVSSDVEKLAFGGSAIVTYDDPEIDPDELASLKDVNVYPNPFNHQFKINLNQTYSDIQVSLIDITGKTLFNRSYKNKTVVELNNLELPSGVYFVKLSTKNLEKTVKVVKQ